MSEKNSNSLIADSKFQFGTTFLSEYWKSKATLAVETRNAYLVNLLKRSIGTLVTVPATALASVVSVTGALIVLSLFLFFDTNLRRLLDQVGSENEGIIYFSNEATDKEISEVEGILKGFSGVENRYISKEEALEIFTKDLGARKDLLNGLEGNPLPKSIEFTISGADIKKSTEGIQDALGETGDVKKSGVEEIIFGAPWAQSAEKLRVGVLQVSLSVLMIVVLVVVFLVSNVIKLMLFSQKEEIEIMQLVGSTSSRISAPYLLSGGILGLLGAIMALVLSFFIFIVFLKPLNSYLLFGVSYQVFQFLSLGNVFFVLIAGLGLGICGSFLAIKKWLVK